ncbi:ABC-type polysaccharide/polyol phosphate transport system, ATPase component [Roseomonas rosea]|jgi:lipopolysaccharide transport system ATP-binding protein|uniref:ABC-type polysaccharide/polyol phosphate transport system, ATPase component n=1 Tax=Muricoccus roseus TaxID=198092 RepID=A0A1M6C4Q4_9PROT|nr:ABC transporter ATP-binding protein [Roseomonas rosea]SHI56000.1 ABC-type polysaccharide/polyol phosphate transport system, ATPase component [Roseomonas rosea]
MALIEAKDLRVEFPLYHLAARSLKKSLLARAAVRVRTDEANRVVVSALRDLNFRIESGERVALIGRNGAGKTTLLRSLAGIYEPVGGHLRIEGTIGSLIDPAAGMDQDSTGRENIRLRALYRNLDAAGQAALEQEVVDFAGLGEFIDVPIKGYSAGMSIRLAFAIATAMQPHILLMDEWFMAGDASFMDKAEARLNTLISGADIMVIATHNMDIVRRLCTRAIRLDAGRILADGPVDPIVDEMLAEAG